VRRLFLVLTLIVLGLVVPASARAQPMDDCSPTPTIQSLRTCVQHAADHRHIDNNGVARSLIAKLDAAQAAVDRGQTAVAVNQLNAFIQELHAQAGKHILGEHAEHLLLHAQAVIQALPG